jgi:N-acetylglutamate synthase-like GNAT family acetyltransferase
MNVRLATQNDKEQVVNLFSQFKSILQKKYGYYRSKTQTNMSVLKNYDSVIHSDLIKIFVIENSQGVIGAASFFIYPDLLDNHTYAHIDDFVIDEINQKQGYGTQLMQGIIQYAKSQNIREIQLIALSDVVTFYEKIGAKKSQISMKIDLNNNETHTG